MPDISPDFVGENVHQRQRIDANNGIIRVVTQLSSACSSFVSDRTSALTEIPLWVNSEFRDLPSNSFYMDEGFPESDDLHVKDYVYLPDSTCAASVKIATLQFLEITTRSELCRAEKPSTRHLTSRKDGRLQLVSCG